MNKPRVIVAGAGPVGLLCALALARQDIPVLVLETEPALTHDLRAGSFHPPTLEMMAPFGITAKMLEIGIPVPRWQIRDRYEGLIAEWDLSMIKGETPFPFRLHLEQHRLTPIIYDLLRQIPHAQVRFSTQLTGLEQDAGGVTVHAESGGQAESFRGDWLIGADGGRSMVRKALDIEFEGFTWPEKFIVISTPLDLAGHGFTGNAYVADPGEFCAVFKMPHVGPPGLWRIAFGYDGTLPDEEILSEERVEALMQRFLARKERYDVVYKSTYSVHQRVAKDFRKGRVLLAGDAAHINNPLGAFGLNGGIHDAINLAEKLGRVWRREAGDELLDLYVRQRRTANVEFVQKNSIQNKRTLEERDPVKKKERFDELRRANADPKLAHEFLLNSSMINSVRRAASIQ